MLAWADQVDLTLRERQLRKRMSLGLLPDDEAEKKAVSAVRHEETGDVGGARDRWQALLLFKELKDPENRPWGLLAEKRLADLDAMELQLRELQHRVELARNQQKEFEPADEREAQAARALRFELFGDFARAKEIWSSLPGSRSESGPRVWILMAAAKIRELTPKAEAEENLKGVSLVRQRLKEAATLKTKEPAKASLIYRDIVFLYEKNSELADEVGEAVSMLASLTMPEEPKKP